MIHCKSGVLILKTKVCTEHLNGKKKSEVPT